MNPDELVRRLKALLEQETRDLEGLKMEIEGKLSHAYSTLSVIRQWEEAK